MYFPIVILEHQLCLENNCQATPALGSTKNEIGPGRPEAKGVKDRPEL